MWLLVIVEVVSVVFGHIVVRPLQVVIVVVVAPCAVWSGGPGGPGLGGPGFSDPGGGPGWPGGGGTQVGVGVASQGTVIETTVGKLPVLQTVQTVVVVV